MKGVCIRRKSPCANLKIGDHTHSLVDIYTGNCCFTVPERSSDEEKPSFIHSTTKTNYLFLNLNVGGKQFQIDCHAAARYPVTRLGRMATCVDPIKRLDLCDDFSVQRNEYFFDRDPTVFCYIFHFYHSGILWIMDELCPANFLEEIEYWGIHLNYTQKCCRSLFEEHQDEMNEHLKIQRDLQAEIDYLDHEKYFEGKWFGGLRKKIWNLVENPYSSIPAKIIAILSSIFVLVSVVTMCLSTVEELKHMNLYGKSYMEHVEAICVIFFTTEYAMRLLSASDIKRFLKTVLNIVDLIAILPFYIQVVFEKFSEDADIHVHRDDIEKMEQVGQFGKVLKIICLMRIFRILKLARHSTGLRAFGFTIRQCYQQVCCLFLFIAMGVFTFSALMYSVEHDIPGTNFTSIPDAWWWAAVSISTVGYGDTVPDTALGRFVAFLCISFGIILNGMPISILYNRFSDFYAKLKAHETTCVAKPGTEIKFKERIVKKITTCFPTPQRIH
ncbi:PREDICTED: potassium voltage-gated channel subfamily V member 2-like [Nanorana parkeri]|uniref:potassium voltage-gated channel subfamily V member 2-like n=1 Tax=Nanorana parkeri TaxID=125878 RepID=UPI0008544592|nr:PREDICTED: potassium voltage-gated channel subfamily V member 2-like [Nanorana parkeri]